MSAEFESDGFAIQSAVISDHQPGRGLQGAGLARFMELRGRRVIEACGVLWYGTDAHFYLSLPHQLRFGTDRGEIKRFLWKSSANGVRHPSLTSPGLPSGLYVYRDKQYDLSSLHRNFRAKVRRGLEQCEIRPMDEAELLRQGFTLNLETMQRQGRYDPEFGSGRQWRRLVEAIRRCPAITAMGAFNCGRLAAYAIVCREDGWLHILHRMSRNADLECCPNHVLDFTLTQEITRDPTLEAVSMGYASLVSTWGLHEYKTRLGYTLCAHNSVVQLHPAIEPLFKSRALVHAVDVTRRRWPRVQTLERISSVLHGALLSHQQKLENGKKESDGTDRNGILPA
jgi:hypothetical protein